MQRVTLHDMFKSQTFKKRQKTFDDVIKIFPALPKK